MVVLSDVFKAFPDEPCTALKCPVVRTGVIAVGLRCFAELRAPAPLQ